MRFNADRRLKLFDLKATQYSQYVTDLGAFGKKNQVEMPARMQPIFERYFSEYMTATEAGDKQRERAALEYLNSQTLSLMNKGLQDVTKLKYESNKLKLIATDEMLETFEKIESLNQEMFDITNKYMNAFTDIIMKQQAEKTELFQSTASRLGNEQQMYSKRLLQQMRQEINDI